MSDKNLSSGLQTRLVLVSCVNINHKEFIVKITKIWWQWKLCGSTSKTNLTNTKGLCRYHLDYSLYKHLTLQHYWWSSWHWNQNIQVDDKLHGCLWSPKGHYTQSPTVHCSRPPDDQRCRQCWWIHFVPALVDQKSELCICECMCMYTCVYEHRSL